jgi:hypothetical protein
MSAVYPTSIKTYTTKTNHIDVYDADHVNSPQEEIVALQTYVGTNPHGNRNSLSDRMNALSNGSGGFVLTTGIPSETYPGKFWYRTDTESLQNVKSDNTVQTIGGSFSNVLFSYVGPVLNASVHSTSFTNASVNGTSLPKWISTAANLYGTVVYARIKKITGVTSLKVDTIAWTGNAAQGSPLIRYTISNLIATATTSSTNPVLVSTSFDLSGLTNGTTYDFIAELQASGGGGGSFIHSITGIAS